MSTHQSIAPLTPRFRIRPGIVATALGVLIAIAVTTVFLTVGSAHHATLATPVTPAPTAGIAAPQLHYLGPLQQRAASSPNSGAVSPSSDAGAPHYTCLGVSAALCNR